jgi:hypothetical protein
MIFLAALVSLIAVVGFVYLFVECRLNPIKYLLRAEAYSKALTVMHLWGACSMIGIVLAVSLYRIFKEHYGHGPFRRSLWKSY